MQTNHFLVLKKLKNTESAQLWIFFVLKFSNYVAVCRVLYISLGSYVA